MVVSFWSYKHGQSGTTSNLGAIASMLAIKYLYSNVVFSTKFGKSTLDRLFLTDDYVDDLIDTQAINTGVDALFKNMKNRQANKELISDFTTTVVNKRLEVLVSTNNVNKELYINTFLETLEEFLNIFVNDANNFTFVDVESGLDYFVTNKVLDTSEMVVVNINQNKFILDEMFSDRKFIELAESKKLIYVIGNYDKDSNLNVKNIARRYGIPKELIYTIPYNRIFADYCSSNQILDFVLMNMKAKKNEENYEFTQSIEKCMYGILDTLGLERSTYLIEDIN